MGRFTYDQTLERSFQNYHLLHDLVHKNFIKLSSWSNHFFLDKFDLKGPVQKQDEFTIKKQMFRRKQVFYRIKVIACSF